MQLKVSELRLSSYFYSKLHHLSEKNIVTSGCQDVCLYLMESVSPSLNM